MKAMRWSGENDRYWWRFTYAPRRSEPSWGIVLGSGDNDDYPGCRLRLELGKHTIVVALPQIIKPLKVWHEITTEPTRSQMIEQGREPGYHNNYSREYGLYTFDRHSLHFHFGEQTHDSTTDKSKVWFYPWKDRHRVRQSLYGLDGSLFGNIPVPRRGGWAGMSIEDRQDQWRAEEAVRDACPVKHFEFLDFDNEFIVATCRIEETEYARGRQRGFWQIMSLLKNEVYRSLDIRFHSEVGKRKGSWKGGTIGHSIAMLPGELHEEAFLRYCHENGLKFLMEVDAPPVKEKVKS